MPKKFLVIILLFTLMILSAGCSNSEKPVLNTPEPVTEVPVMETKMPVYDNNGNLLGEIDSRANCTAVDAGIFYSISELVNYEPTATAEYRFFNKEDKTDVLLGKFEDQGYEAYYTRTELNGCIYTLVIKGAVNSDAVPLVLLAFDPARKTMKSYTVSEYGFPYADMAVINGKLLIMNHEMSDEGADKIFEFNTADETLKEVLSFSADTDSLRGICSADDGFYLLRLEINDSGLNEMFMDLYDLDYSKKSEQSINEIMVNALSEMPGMLNRQEALDELGMNVVNFSVIDGRYMFYENFSVSRVIIDLRSRETLMAKDDLYSISSGNGNPVIYRMDFDKDNAEGPEIIALQDGKPVNVPFKPVDSHKLLRLVSRSASGTWVVTTSDDSRSYSWTLAIHLWTE